MRERVHRFVGSWLSDDECMQIALCCNTREPEDILSFLFNTNVRRSALKNVRELALTASEWTACFGVDSRANRDGGLGQVVKDADFVKKAEKLASALRCTISEPMQNASWQRPWTKAAALLSVHSEDPEPMLTSTLGDLVRADLRRLEDLRLEMEEKGVETMLLSQLVVGIAKSVA